MIWSFQKLRSASLAISLPLLFQPLCLRCVCVSLLLCLLRAYVGAVARYAFVAFVGLVRWDLLAAHAQLRRR